MCPVQQNKQKPCFPNNFRKQDNPRKSPEPRNPQPSDMLGKESGCAALALAWWRRNLTVNPQTINLDFKGV